MAVDGGSRNAEVDPGKMSIIELKDWLSQHDQQEKLWELGQCKAKKPEYVECVRGLM